MFSMPSQNTRRKVRLNEKVESRVRGDLYARFGGECLETYHCKKWQGAGCLAYGQIASAKIPLSRMISPQLYWVMSGDDFTLDINNPDDPKILCVGNNPDRQNIYGAALGLYNSRIVKPSKINRWQLVYNHRTFKLTFLVYQLHYSTVI